MSSSTDLPSVLETTEKYIRYLDNKDLRKIKKVQLDAKKFVTLLTNHAQCSYNKIFPIGNFDPHTKQRPWTKPQWLHSTLSVLIHLEFPEFKPDFVRTVIEYLDQDSLHKLHKLCLKLVALDDDGMKIYEHMKTLLIGSEGKFIMVDTNEEILE